MDVQENDILVSDRGVVYKVSRVTASSISMRVENERLPMQIFEKEAFELIVRTLGLKKNPSQPEFEW